MTGIESFRGAVPVMDQYVFWAGRSGCSYIHTVFTVVPDWSQAANYILVRRGDDGSCSPLYIGETDDMSRRWQEHRRSGLVGRALERGANELHLHFLTKTRSERLDAETDLRHGNPTPLNEQSTPNALRPRSRGLFGLGEHALAGKSNALLEGLSALEPHPGGLLGSLLDFVPTNNNVLSALTDDAHRRR